MKIISDRVKLLRRQHGLSRAQMAEILKVSRPTFSLIENEGRKLTLEETINLANHFSLSIDELVNLEEPPVKNETFNWAKFKEGILYTLMIVGAYPNVGDTVLCKLIYFMDADHLELHSTPIFNAKYIANHFGPTPVELPEALSDLRSRKELESIKKDYFEFQQTKHIPLREPDKRYFSESEIRVMDAVIQVHGRSSARELSDFSHKDPPWLETEPQCEIDLSLVKKRVDEVSALKRLKINSIS